MKKIVLDARVDQGGVARYGRDLAQALSRLSDAHQILVIHRGRGLVGATVSAPFTPWGRGRVARSAERVQADLIHGLHLEAPRVRDIPVVVTIHDIIPLEYQTSMANPIRRKVFARLLSSAIGRAQRIIAPSDLTRQALLRHGADDARIRIVPIGVSEAFTESNADVSVARRSFGRDRRYVAAVVGAKAHKNEDGLLRAATQISDSGVTVACLGATSHRLPSNVHRIGRLSDPDLRSFYQAAEALVLPSFIEGYGLPALEAAACGTPVICGENIGVLRHIRRGAVIVDVSKPREIAEAIERLVEDPVLRNELSHAAREAGARLTTQAMARATVAVYDEVLRQS